MTSRASDSYKYVTIDSKHKKMGHELTKFTVDLGAHAIKQAKKVAVLKAGLPNTGYNVEKSQQTNTISYIENWKPTNSIGGVYKRTLTLKDGYYSADELCYYLSTKDPAILGTSLADGGIGEWSTQVLYGAARSSVLDTNYELVFAFDRDNYRVTMTLTEKQNASGTLSIAPTGDPDSRLWQDLGFLNSQLYDLSQWADAWQTTTYPPFRVAIAGTMKPTLVKLNKDDSRQWIKWSPATAPTPNSINRGRTISKIENAEGYFIHSRELTARGRNGLHTTNIDEFRNPTPSDVLLYMPNTVSKFSYLHYQANTLEWHDLNCDVKEFDIELRNHNNLPFGPDSIHDFKIVLLFLTNIDSPYEEVHTRAWNAEGYAKAHR